MPTIIPFNKPFIPKSYFKLAGNSFESNKLFNSTFHHKCLKLLGQYYKAKKIILTTSCTSALELIARAINIKKGDEIIVPSYTYTSSANAFASFGAKIIFADSENQTPNVSVNSIIEKITNNTKAIVVVHYGGYPIDVQKLRKKLNQYNKNILIIEDAAHCIGNTSQELPICTFSDFTTISFHETKNITCGQGGALFINNEDYLKSIDIIKENGTNRLDFINKKIDFYTWQNIGTNHHINEVTCRLLYANLRLIKKITLKRKQLCTYYYKSLKDIKAIKVPHLQYIENSNGHIFYIVTSNSTERDNLIAYCKKNEITLNTHYLSLHNSPFYLSNHNKYEALKNAEKYSNQLVRLPLFYDLTKKEQDQIIKTIQLFYK